MIDKSRYIVGGKVRREVIVQDVTNQRLTHRELEDLIADPDISNAFFGPEYVEKVPKKKWDEKYLRRLINAQTGDAFNPSYLYLLEEVAGHLKKENKLWRKVLKWIGIGILGILTLALTALLLWGTFKLVTLIAAHFKTK